MNRDPLSPAAVDATARPDQAEQFLFDFPFDVARALQRAESPEERAAMLLVAEVFQRHLDRARRAASTT
jgi:hypothetical protein